MEQRGWSAKERGWSSGDEAAGMEQQGAATSTNTARGRNQVQLPVGCRCTKRSTCRERERQLQGLRSGAGARNGAEQEQVPGARAGAQVASERQERSRAAMEKHTTGLGWRRQQREEMTEEARGWSEG